MKTWQPKDTKELVRAFEAGASIESLAIYFDRTEWSIIGKLYRCGYDMKGRTPRKKDKVIRSKIVSEHKSIFQKVVAWIKQ